MDFPRQAPAEAHRGLAAQLDDESAEGCRLVLGKLRRALRPSDAARRQAMSYDLNRHLELVSAYKAELARLKGEEARLSATALAGART